MSVIPKAFPPEFRRDVVAVTRKGEVPDSQIAKAFGSPSPVCTARQGDLSKMTYSLVKDLAADGILVAVTCQVPGFSTQVLRLGEPWWSLAPP
jgi:hypothetical protein